MEKEKENLENQDKQPEISRENLEQYIILW